jgi:hypothetical protein
MLSKFRIKIKEVKLKDGTEIKQVSRQIGKYYACENVPSGITDSGLGAAIYRVDTQLIAQMDSIDYLLDLIES